MLLDLFDNIDSIIEPVYNSFIDKSGVSLYIKREDKLHHLVSGNKFRKLKYNFLKAIYQKKKGILTFGGAYSNHIYATAALGKLSGLSTIGIIRGEELTRFDKSGFLNNSTLKFAKSQGMKLNFISRNLYRKTKEIVFLKELEKKYPNYLILSEGGLNLEAIKGCQEILSEKEKNYEYICVAMGTGGTFSALVNSCYPHQRVIGIPVLKNAYFLESDCKKWINTSNANFEIFYNYHHGGYAKVSDDLIYFINDFKTQTKIKLDPLYTGKMMYAVFDLIKKGYFEYNSRILVIHTGGLQGIHGINQLLKNKNRPIIN